MGPSLGLTPMHCCERPQSRQLPQPMKQEACPGQGVMRGLSRAANPGPWRGEGVGGLCIPRSSPLGSRIAAASSSRRSSESFLLRGLPGPASGLWLPLLIPFLEGRSRSLFPSPATSRGGERKTGHRLSISPGSVGGLAEPRGQGPRLAGAGQLGTSRTAMEAENQEARPTPQHTHPHKDSVQSPPLLSANPQGPARQCR